MKKLCVLLSVIVLGVFNISAQNQIRQKVAVLNLDTKGFAYDPVQAGNIARIELDKLNMFDVMDRYDIDYLLDKESQTVANCYGKLCLLDVAKKIKAEKMLTGSIEILSERIYISLRMIDVVTGSVEKTQVQDFLNVKDQVQAMISFTLKKMYNVPYDEAIFAQLTKVDAFDSSVNKPNQEKVSLSGPRMGVAFYTGETANRLRLAENKGGYDMVPVMFQFGYQFEVQYIGQGNFQALAEFLPMISGLDQGKIIPSFTILNGLRDNRLGIEIAFGPTFIFNKRAKGYYGNNVWHLEGEWTSSQPNPNNLVTRLDIRGENGITAGFIFAVGKTFKSGRLNIPVNAYVRPDYKNGSQYGISVGFNARSRS